MDFWCQLLEVEVLQDMNNLGAKAQHKNCLLATAFYNFKKEMLTNVWKHTIVHTWTCTVCHLNSCTQVHTS